MTKYIFVTGGVVSGLGKGITAASIGRLLKERGLKKKATDEQRMEIASKSGILALKLVLPVSLRMTVRRQTSTSDIMRGS